MQRHRASWAAWYAAAAAAATISTLAGRKAHARTSIDGAVSSDLAS
jgi:hypothetical protein